MRSRPDAPRMGFLDKLLGKKGESAGAATGAGAAPTIDPVCKMTVDPATAKWSSVHGGTTYSFCSPGCKASFDQDPHKYLGHHAH